LPRSLKILDVSTVPLTVATAKEYLRVLHNDDDTQIENLIAAGVEEFEQRTGRAFSAMSAELRLSEFPCGSISIPRPPLVAVSSITYTNRAGEVVTLDSSEYTVDTSHAPGLVSTPVDWPVNLERPGSIVVSFTAGDPDNCSKRILNALLLWLDLHYHDNDGPTAARLTARIDAILSDRALHAPGLQSVTVLN
jgi:uncharacterized phiE125 gp8 family phage protein